MISTIGFVAASTAAFGEISQAEVDRIVDSEILMCEHEEDAGAIEKSLKERGATDEMLAHSYYFVMAKTQNAERGSLNSEKFHSAVFGFANVASGPMLTNLLNVAKVSTNDLDVSDAILAYHGREPSSRFLMRWCITEASKTNSSEVTSAIWTCLDKTMKEANPPEDLRRDILECARKGLGGSPLSAFAADRILAVHEPTYRNSALRKQVAARIIATKGIPMTDVVRRHFEDISSANMSNP